MKYVGNKRQTQAMNHQDFATPTHAYSHMSPIGRQPTAGAGSMLSREQEDSMFQTSEASASQHRNRFPPNILPKIGSANPDVKDRFKRTTAYANTRPRDSSEDADLRGRQLSTAQPKNGFKFAKGA